MRFLRFIASFVCNKFIYIYILTSMFLHIGGHYTAYCQNVVTEQWYEYDDQYVTEVDVSQVINCEAYVLFYR